jgi:signal transduction histidine kinase
VKNVLGKLRWRLTASYIGVTVASLLLILVLIAIPIFTYILPPIDVTDPDFWVEEIYGSKFVEFMREFLAQSPPDVFGARLLINNLEVLSQSSYAVVTLRDISLSIKTVAQLEAAVVDAEGKLLGATVGESGSTAYTLADFRSRGYPEVDQIMQAALNGETDVTKLSARREGKDVLLLAIPVYEHSNSLTVLHSDRLLGAMLIVVKSLPSQEFLPAYILRILGTALIWFLIAAGAVGALFGFLIARHFELRFRKLYVAADHWSQGDFSELVQDRGTDELGQLADRMNQMAVQLSGLLAERQAMAVSQERNRLARELHDSAKQQAFGAAFQLGSAISKLDRDADKNDIKQSLIQAQDAINTVRRELTDLIHELSPPEMEDRSLADAIQQYATEWAHSSEIEVNLDVEQDQELPPEGRQALYRMIQEALANVAKHSQASRAEIRLTYDPGLIRLEIVDNGVGFDIKRPGEGFGLNSMRERAAALGGTFELASQVGEGTTITVQVPRRGR